MRSETLPEPQLQPSPSGAEKRLNGVIERSASILTSVVAALLMLFVILAVGGLVMDAWQSLVHEHNAMKAAVAGMNSAFVVIILLELVHTTLSRGPISSQVQEFLLIGITSAVRTGLEAAAAGRSDGSPREVAIQLAITAFSALLLVVALWLVRQRLNAEKQPRTEREDRKSHSSVAREEKRCAS